LASHIACALSPNILEQRHGKTLKDKILRQQENAALKRPLAEPARKPRPTG